ncbi:hypothetical protein CROQUDRAFT_91721 [Cronartium quercuum f. sp. fusiforme G11]|uniref:Uncharacterized protein n=1 Tax=Cronartium quercuum f. sp. fusiforme G11 TaxID=708437 RepID=A0A9P6NHW6_9BASI|nr:hypothetical protein CROQUDRAFT_91721 [Cronartium quercuum f. sp. fusiforme G11]
MLILELDLQFFDKVNTFQDLENANDSRLPIDAEVSAKKAELMLAHGPTPEPAASSSSPCELAESGQSDLDWSWLAPLKPSGPGPTAPVVAEAKEQELQFFPMSDRVRPDHVFSVRISKDNPGGTILAQSGPIRSLNAPHQFTLSVANQRESDRRRFGILGQQPLIFWSCLTAREAKIVGLVMRAFQ